ncbi:MAG TPA: radical SAM protein [Myxococcales bacterium]|jgi:radical SAM protein with 4Fe4S-binding SPASM domain
MDPSGLVHSIQRQPKNAIWEITSLCNLRCRHCESSAGCRDPNELTTDEALKLCDDLAEAGCLQCNVSGGEPLMRKDWPQICARLASHGLKVNLVTNGTLLDEEAIATAQRHGVSAFALSFDGLQPTHDRIRPHPVPGRSQFAEVVAALERLQKVGALVATITHINRWNYGELEAMHALLGEKGVARWQVQLGMPQGRQREIEVPYTISPEMLPELAARLVALIQSEKLPGLLIVDDIGYYTEVEPVLRSSPGKNPSVWTGCYAGILNVGIESNGDVKGCSGLPKEFVAGNVRARPFREIWADESRFAYNTCWHESKLTGFCARCPYRRICRAGCTAMAYSVTGSIYDNPYCLHRVLTQRQPFPPAACPNSGNSGEGEP